MDTPNTELPRVIFGPRDNQTMPLSWASDMLWMLRERNQKLFGDLLAQAAMNGRANDGS